MSRSLHKKIFLMTVLFLAGALPISVPAFSQPAAFTLNAKSKAAIVLPQNATLPEQTAARELVDYLTKITGGEFKIQAETAAGSTPRAIYVGNTQFAKRAGVAGSTLASEAWRIKTQKANLILVGGGTRGTLYATYHFLEDVCGVRWWNPWEETVPKLGVLPVRSMDVRGKPAFAYRDIYSTYGHDDGRFAIRSRLDRDGDGAFGAQYGGSRNYGPPYHVHTFYGILSPEKYFKDHPDWFLGSGSEMPKAENSQLHMSNPEMRQEFLKLLRELIRKAHLDAKEKGLPAPDVFSVSQMDNAVKFAGPNDAELLAKNDGAESAILLGFINFLADGIKDEFPDVYIDTLAYFSGEKAPKTIRPRDNVIIRLTDTTSNQILPMTDARNHAFRENVEAWSKISKNLRIWDYAVNYGYPGLPLPNAATFAPDYRFLKAHNVEGIFTEHEYPILADMRDFKVWVQCKLLENPDLNYAGLTKEFTDGFYGRAGVHVRRYINALQDEADKVGKEKGYEDMTWFIPPKPYNYLSPDFLLRANAIFDEAERAAGANTVLQRRVRHARMPLDRYINLFYRTLARQWGKAGYPAEKLPFDRDKISARSLQSWNEQIDLRLPEINRAGERTIAANEVKKLTTGSLYADKIPAKFREISASKLTVYGPRDTRNYADHAKVVADTQTELGEATRFEFADAEVERYKLPMPLGIYDIVGKKELVSDFIEPEDIPGSGYHWYQLNDVTLPSNAYIYFFWSWYIQIDLNSDFDEENPQQQFEVWVNLKFEGPMFPHGKVEDKNAISLERVVLVKK